MALLAAFSVIGLAAFLLGTIAAVLEDQPPRPRAAQLVSRCQSTIAWAMATRKNAAKGVCGIAGAGAAT